MRALLEAPVSPLEFIEASSEMRMCSKFGKCLIKVADIPVRLNETPPFFSVFINCFKVFES